MRQVSECLEHRLTSHVNPLKGKSWGGVGGGPPSSRRHPQHPGQGLVRLTLKPYLSKS